MKNQNTFYSSFRSAFKVFFSNLPLIFGIILLVSLANSAIPKDFYTKIFQGNFLLDSFIGGFIGSISFGTPITSYIIGGELLSQGISLIAVTAFLVAWVTVGFIQLPAEIVMLGRRFAITRNLLSFIFAIIVAIISVLILEVLA